MSQRVLLVVTLNGTQRHFYALRKDCSLYQHDFWNSDDDWADDAMSTLQQSKDGAVFALRSPICLATGNTFRMNTFELYALVDRLRSTTRCVRNVAEHMTERDREMILNVQCRNAEAKKI